MATRPSPLLFDPADRPQTVSPMLSQSPLGLTGVDRAEMDAAGGNAFTNNFTGARITSDADTLLGEEASLRAAGDPQSLLRAEQLRPQIESLQAQSQAYTAGHPSRYEDVLRNGAVDWGKVPGYVAGQVGMGPGSSVDMMATGAGIGAAGRVLSLIPHPAAKLVGAGLSNIVAPAAMYAQNVGMQKGEAYGSMRDNPTIMATKTPEEINRAALIHGLRAAALDTVLPAMVARKLTGGRLPKMFNNMGLSKTLLADAAVEGGTETLQQVSQQNVLSNLNPQRDTSGDASELVNSALGGALGSLGLGGIHHVAAASFDRLAAPREGKRGEEVTLGDAIKQHAMTYQQAKDAREILAGAPPASVPPEQYGEWGKGLLARQQQVVVDALKDNPKYAALVQQITALDPNNPDNATNPAMVAGIQAAQSTGPLSVAGIEVLAEAEAKSKKPKLNQEEPRKFGSAIVPGQVAFPDTDIEGQGREGGPQALNAAPKLTHEQELAAAAARKEAARLTGATPYKTGERENNISKTPGAGPTTLAGRVPFDPFKPAERAPDTQRGLGGSVGSEGTAPEPTPDVKKATARVAAQKAMQEDHTQRESLSSNILWHEFQAAAPETGHTVNSNARALMQRHGEEVAAMASEGLKTEPTPEETARAEQLGRTLGSMLGKRTKATLDGLQNINHADASPVFKAMYDKAVEYADAGKSVFDKIQLDRDTAVAAILKLITPEAHAKLLAQGVSLSTDPQHQHGLLSLLEKTAAGENNIKGGVKSLQDIFGAEPLKKMLTLVAPGKIVPRLSDKAFKKMYGVTRAEYEAAYNTEYRTETKTTDTGEEKGPTQEADTFTQNQLAQSHANVAPTSHVLTFQQKKPHAAAGLFDGKTLPLLVGKDQLEATTKKRILESMVERMRGFLAGPAQKPSVRTLSAKDIQGQRLPAFVDSGTNRGDEFASEPSGVNAFNIHEISAKDLMDRLKMPETKRIALMQRYLGGNDEQLQGQMSELAFLRKQHQTLSALVQRESLSPDKRKLSLHEQALVRQVSKKDWRRIYAMLSEADKAKLASIKEPVANITAQAKIVGALVDRLEKKLGVHGAAHEDFFADKWLVIAEEMSNKDHLKLSLADIQPMVEAGTAMIKDTQRAGLSKDKSAALQAAKNLIRFTTPQGVERAVPSYMLLEWVYKMRDAHPELDKKGNIVKEEGRGLPKNIRRDLLEGVDALLSSEFVAKDEGLKGIYITDAKGVRQTFADGVPPGLAFGTSTQARLAFGREARAEKKAAEPTTRAMTDTVGGIAQMSTELAVREEQTKVFDVQGAEAVDKALAVAGGSERSEEERKAHKAQRLAEGGVENEVYDTLTDENAYRMAKTVGDKLWLSVKKGEDGLERVMSVVRALDREAYYDDKKAFVGGDFYVAPLVAMLTPRRMELAAKDFPEHLETLKGLRTVLAGKLLEMTNATNESGRPAPKITFAQLNQMADFMAGKELTPNEVIPFLNQQAPKAEGTAPITRAKPTAAAAPARATPEFDKLPAYVPGQRTMVYAGVGSRKTPPAVLAVMRKVAERLGARGYTLNSGAALGADRAFESGAGGKKNIFRTSDATDQTRAIAKETHAAPNALKGFILDLMARNTNQVFGENLDSPVDFVLAWTPDGAETAADVKYYGRDDPRNTGGTGQAIVLASRKGVPVINMAKEGWAQRVADIVAGKNGAVAQVAQPGEKVAQQEPTTLNVWHGSSENAQFSNLASRPFTANGHEYLSVEHAYQSLKSGVFDQVTFNKYKSAGKKIPGRLGTKTEGGWNLVLMKKLVAASFKQNPEAAAALTATGDAQFTHAQDKGVWAKEFPRILTEVRSELRSSEVEPRGSTSELRGSTSELRGSVRDMPMYYKDGQEGMAMRPEYRGKSTMDLIREGVRTATTGAIGRFRGLKVGDVFTVVGKDDERIPVRLTHLPERVSSVSREEWSKREGWAPEVYDKYKDAWQARYELGKLNEEEVSAVDQHAAALRQKQRVGLQTVADEAAEHERLTAIAISTAKTYFARVLDPKVKALFASMFPDYLGKWNHATQTAEIATADPYKIMQLAYHESLHALYSNILAGMPNTREMLEKAMSAPEVMDRLRGYLKGSPKALAAIENDPEERVAYAYQFWAHGLLDLGKPPTGFFEHVQKFLRRVFGVVRDDERALSLFLAFNKGELKELSPAGEVISKIMSEGKWREQFAARFDRQTEWLKTMALPAHDILMNSESETLRKIASMWWSNPADASSADLSGVIDNRARHGHQYSNRFTKQIRGLKEGELKELSDALNTGNPALTPGLAGRQQRIYELMEHFHDYLIGAGVKINKIQGGKYYPVVYNLEYVIEHRSEFTDMLKTKYANVLKTATAHANSVNPGVVKTVDDIADAMVQTIIDRGGVDQKGLAATREDGVLNPYFASQNNRSFDWIRPEDRTPFLSTDVVATMTRYFSQGTRSAEYVRRFGQGGQLLRDMMAREGDFMTMGADGKPLFYDDDGPVIRELKAAGAKIGLKGAELAKWVQIREDDAKRANGAMEGVLGKEITAGLRKANSFAMVYQNLRLLPFSLFSSMLDPNGIRVVGGEWDDMIQAYVRGMKAVWHTWGDVLLGNPINKWERGNDLVTNAEISGTVDSTMELEGMGAAHTSEYTAGPARKINRGLFLANGMSAWDRWMRISATEAAMKFIMRHDANADPKNSKRWMTGLGLKQGDVTIENGRLIINKQELKNIREADLQRELNDEETKQLSADIEQVHVAINRWVNRAILTPNAAQRPTIGSDPHYAALFHLKQFTYTFQKTTMRYAMDELKAGNPVAASQMMMGIPIMIAADLTKAMMLGGGSLPSYMNGWTMADWIKLGIFRGSVLGAGQLGVDALQHPLSMFGPTVSQVGDVIGDTLTGNLSHSIVDAAPLARSIAAADLVRALD